jgi:hypothetical protein
MPEDFMSKLGASVRARRRLRRTAEILVDDIGLRSNLTDIQAERLLDWGLAHVQETAVNAAELTDEEALPLLEEQVSVVRRIMRLVNRLMETSGDSVGEHDERLTQLLGNLTRLTGQEATATQLASIDTFARTQPKADERSAFQILMELLEHPAESTQEEE